MLLARNRARNDASNRTEFLHDVKKRRRDASTDSPTCARTDAKEVDRDVMMKFDVARNEEGPLRRTMKTELKELASKRSEESEDGLTAQRHPGLDERLHNLETHLAVRY